MNDLILPQEEDYRVVIDQRIDETRHAIKQALGYIKRQEDGPLTMRHALKRIDKTVNAIEDEVRYLTGALDRLEGIAAKLLEQRDEALRQRDLLIAVSGLREYGDQP
jgi:septal ring factor EnvC (AmiA/AmiB activator)